MHTQQKHRLKGYARRLLSDTVEYVTRRGYAVSMLFGIPDFYHRFGFLPAIPEHTTVVATRDAEQVAEQARRALTEPKGHGSTWRIMP